MEASCKICGGPADIGSGYCDEHELQVDTNSKGQRLERMDEWPYVRVAGQDTEKGPYRPYNYRYERMTEGVYNIIRTAAGGTVFSQPVVAVVGSWREAEAYIQSAPKGYYADSEVGVE